MPRWTEEHWDAIIESQYKVVDTNSLEEYKPTNADRIRAMSDEELEKFLSMCVSDCQGRKLEKREFCKGCPFDTGVGYCTEKRIKKWLQSEAE